MKRANDKYIIATRQIMGGPVRSHKQEPMFWVELMPGMIKHARRLVDAGEAITAVGRRDGIEELFCIPRGEKK